MGNKLLTQVILVITAGTIIMTYIRPAFTEISNTQDEIARFESTVSQAAQLNSALGELVATEQSISDRERSALQRYLPTEVQDVVVMRDIQNIFQISDIPITSLSSVSAEGFQSSEATVEGSEVAQEDTGAPSLIFRDFKLSFFGTYQQLKRIMERLEINAYPLEVVELNFTSPRDPEAAAEDSGLPPGVMEYDMTLRAFALPNAQ